MDYNKVLQTLTTNCNGKPENFNNELQTSLEKTLPLLSEDATKFVIGEHEEYIDAKYQYLRALVFLLRNIKIHETSSDNEFISINKLRSIKIAIELVTSIGIIPCLLPGIGLELAKLYPKALQLCQEPIQDLQKYERLSFSTHCLIELYDNATFRPSVLSQLGPLLASLFQLSHAPLLKPTEKPVDQQSSGNNEFVMTEELYTKLKNDQEQFGQLLHRILNDCPKYVIMKELMVVLGAKGAPNFLRREIRKYLVNAIVQPNGVTSLIAAVCNNTLDLGEHWNKLDTISRLIVTSHGNNSDSYYKAICPQILRLLGSKQIQHSSTIANCCITALYEYKSDVCLREIVDVICAPLLVKPSNEQETMETETKVEECIENLTKCFITVEAKFKRLPCQVISKVAVPLFSLYTDTRQSAWILKNKVKQLVLLLLYENSLKIYLFSAFLGHSVTGKFGYYALSRFGPTGGIEIIGGTENPKYGEFSETVFDLASTTEALSVDLFTYLLKFLAEFSKSDEQKKSQNLLETDDDAMERIDKQLSAVKLLSDLANTTIVQEAQIKKPEPLFSFIKSLFDEYIVKNKDVVEEDDCEVLYISLMLIKMILSERTKSLDWGPFNDFASFLKRSNNLTNIPPQLSVLIREVVGLIETRGRAERRNYQDLSVDRKESNKFDEAIKDLSDPLLPVRAHGLITLTKLIEIMDPCAIARKAVVLQLFKENLKHEDSFIYLAAINGLCALATSYPEVIIEMLVQEYIDMPQRVSKGELTAETRMKLGEILVKTTRALGEMAPVYKNTLVNGFLCATRDPDPLVRASSLSCLGELCKVLGFRLGDIITEVIYCIGCIIKSDKAPECRRAAVLVATLLLRGLGKDTLTSLGKNLVPLFRGLKYLHDNDDDPVLRLHAQLALQEFDHVVQDFLFPTVKLEKRIFLLDPPS